MEIIDDIDVDLFRNVHVQVQRPAITSLSEAKSLLLQEPKDAKALQYLGWWHLCHAQNYGTAAQFLEKSIDSGMSRFNPSYQNSKLTILHQTLAIRRPGTS